MLCVISLQIAISMGYGGVTLNMNVPNIWFPFLCVYYLVVHPTDRKWVITLVINGISGGNVHL